MASWNIGRRINLYGLYSLDDVYRLKCVINLVRTTFADFHVLVQSLLHSTAITTMLAFKILLLQMYELYVTYCALTLREKTLTQTAKPLVAVNLTDDVSRVLKHVIGGHLQTEWLIQGWRTWADILKDGV